MLLIAIFLHLQTRKLTLSRFYFAFVWPSPNNRRFIIPNMRDILFFFCPDEYLLMNFILPPSILSKFFLF